MRINVYKKDIRFTFGRVQFIIYRWFPYPIRKVVYGNGTHEMAARNERRFRAEAKQAQELYRKEKEERDRIASGISAENGMAASGADVNASPDSRSAITLPDVPPQGVT